MLSAPAITQYSTIMIRNVFIKDFANRWCSNPNLTGKQRLLDILIHEMTINCHSTPVNLIIQVYINYEANIVNLTLKIDEASPRN